jgi:hypothetical protein
LPIDHRPLCEQSDADHIALILCDEMGAGRMAQTQAVFFVHRRETSARATLIVCNPHQQSPFRLQK